MSDALEQLRTALAGQYDVEKAVGAGGMATVYRAMDVKHERTVAIKVLKPDLSVSIGAERFLREIKVAAKLQHPNILGLYDSGSTPDGLVYYVMPFVEGESLRDKLDREKQLPIDEAIQITLEVADALHYAHGQGVIHRDIKPDNILLLKDSGHALVMDFGIARAVSAAGGDKLTQTGMSVGTPHYMSPEQAGGADSVDGRADLYSLGCVLFEMLAGQPPFDGPNTMAILARHAMEAVPSLQIVRNTVPDEVEEIVNGALAKTPADRFATVQSFAEALANADLGAISRRTTARAIPRRTSTFRVPTQAEIPIAPPRRNPWILGGIAAAVVAIGGGLFAWQQATAKKAPTAAAGVDASSIAVLYFDDESPDSSLGFLADGLTEDLIRDFTGVPGVQVVSRNGVEPFRGTDVGADSIARVLRVGTLVAGSVAPEKGDTVLVTVRLLDASGVDLGKRTSLRQSAGSPLALRDSIADKVATLVRERLGNEVRLRQQQAATSSSVAWSLVQRAEQAHKRWRGQMAEATALAQDAAQLPKAEQIATAAERDRLAADSFFRAAAEADPRWSTPWVGRSTLAYEQARVLRGTPLQADPFLAQGIAYADSALSREPTDADALEMRGTNRYFRMLLRLAKSDAEAKDWLTRARGDFDQATKLSPTQAGAWASLSHLYYQVDDGRVTDALMAAQRAYEADTWLANVNLVLERLFKAAYDLGQATDAQKWCTEGRRRFPEDPRFQTCRIWLLTMKGQTPDAAALAEASRILASGQLVVPGQGDADWQERRARIAYAAALARAGRVDSAIALAKSAARVDADRDPARELQLFSAFALGVSRDTAGMIDALKQHFAANAEARRGLQEDAGWWFRDYEQVPAFRELFFDRR